MNTEKTGKCLIIGVDPGLTNIGVAAMISNQVSLQLINTTPNSNIAHRVRECLAQLKKTWNSDPEMNFLFPDYLVMEYQPPHQNNGISIMSGVLCGFFQPKRVIMVTPNSLKKIITGDKRATKAIVSERLTELTGLHFSSDHESDAFALAYVAWTKAIPLQDKGTTAKP